MTNDTAIIGMGCRLPGADGASALWDLVCSGRTTFEPVEESESLRFGYSAKQIEDKSFVAVRSALADFDTFDADFFGISNRDAALMDPQQRVFLETAWSALADGGYADDRASLRIGVFGSSSSSTYLSGPVTDAGMWDGNDINFSAMLANDKDFLCTRTSYTLGLTGPSVVVQSACSSSLLAIHLARASLANGECDLAIVGGVSISLPHLGGYLQRAGSIYSPSGRCRPFDSAADGTVKAHGAAAVILRPVHSLDPSRDRVYAVIAGSAVNNDGSDKAGYAAPGVAGQAAVIAAALKDSAISPSRLRYVETHGTGTQLGDPIEIRALARSRGSANGDPCYLGSVKATVGHLDAAAGVTGLMKTALVLHHRLVPALNGFSCANPLLNLEATDFVAPTQPVRLSEEDTAAGVSAFGMGGTNVHVVMRRPLPGEGTHSTLDRPAPTFARRRHWVAARVPVSSTLSSADSPFAAAGATPAPNRPPREVRVVTDQSVLDLTRQVLADPDLELDTDIFEAGADSLDAIDVLAELRTAWDADLPYSVMERARTPRAFANAVRLAVANAVRLAVAEPETEDAPRALAPIIQDRETSVRSGSTVDNAIRISTGGTRNLFLIHPAGGTTACYADLARHLDPRFNVIGLYFPDEFLGRSLTMRQVAAHYFSVIRDIQTEGPYLIGGYSFGGNLAAEIVLQLQESHIAVERLIMIDSHPPHAYTAGDCSEADYLRAFPRLLQTLLPAVEFSNELVDTTSAQRVLEQITKPEWAPSVRAEFVKFFSIWCENHGALKRWTPDRQITCRILILEASQAEPQDILDHLGIAPTSVHDWERYSAGPVEYAKVEGDHYSIFRAPEALQRMGEILNVEVA